MLWGINRVLAELEVRKRPIRVALIGVGEMGTDILAQTSLMKGIKVVVAADITAEKAIQSAIAAGYKTSQIHVVDNSTKMDEMIAEGFSGILLTENADMCFSLENVDVFIEATGKPEVSAKYALMALRNKKPYITLSVECDIAVGPILYWYAQQKNTVYSLAAGDEPPALQELYDFANALGFQIIAVGKGKNNPLERFATPKTCYEEALKRGVNPYRLCEFVDGTKTMVEMAAVSNATGLIPDVRGMHGPHANLADLLKVFRLKKYGGILNNEGIVDFVIGDVAPAVFLVFTTSNPRLIRALKLRSMGDGPTYLLVRPYHLCSIEVPLSAAVAVIYGKPTMAAFAGYVADVMAVAKRTLLPGTSLDTIGGFDYFGLIDKASKVREENALPIALAEGVRVIRKIEKGEIIRLSDVESPAQSVLWKLRDLQDKWLNGLVPNDSLLQILDTLAL